MTHESHRQHCHPASSGWPRRLFNQTAGIQNGDLQINPDRTAVKPVPEHRKKSGWPKRLFESGRTDIPFGDRLTVFHDRSTVRELHFNSDPADICIGSDPLADVRLEKPNVSRFHARITCRNHRYQLIDTGSRRGTYLNGKKIPPYQPVDLNDGASIRIMAFQLKFDRRTDSHDGPEAAGARARATQANLPAPNPQSLVAPPLTDATASHPDAWSSGIVDLSVAAVVNETETVKTFRLKGEAPLSFSYLPGQFVTLLLEIDGRPEQRSYSMSSSPSRPCTLDLTVKRVPGGLVSNWLCDHLTPGDRLRVKGPAGRFSCLNRPADRYLFIGAGSGIVPLMSMLRWQSDTASPVPASALFSFRCASDVIFARELAVINAISQSIDIAITLTGQPDEGGQLHRFAGRVDRIMLAGYRRDRHKTEVFLCGPDPFMVAVKAILKALGFSAKRIHCESYTPAKDTRLSTPEFNKNPSIHERPAPAARLLDMDGTVHAVTFARSGKTVQVNERASLLELAEAQGIHIDYDCRTGQCGECMVKCISGQTVMDEDCDMDDRDRAQGWLYSCCAHARSDLIIDA